MSDIKRRKLNGAGTNTREYDISQEKTHFTNFSLQLLVPLQLAEQKPKPQPQLSQVMMHLNRKVSSQEMELLPLSIILEWV